MSLVFENNNLPEEIGQKQNSIFIWLDILGFAEAVDNEEEYKKLYEILSKFQEIFNTSDLYSTEIISDGLVLKIKDSKVNDLEIVFKDIAEKQFKFILENKYFIRGGIALGTRYDDIGKNSIFISNGLSRAVKLESSFINWPVIGMDEKNYSEIKSMMNISNKDELFGLQRGYNKNGQLIYFIDFAFEDLGYFSLLQDKINIFEKEQKFDIKNKYIWLLRYYLYKFKGLDLNENLKEFVL